MANVIKEVRKSEDKVMRHPKKDYFGAVVPDLF
jgi:hypothetical protein